MSGLARPSTRLTLTPRRYYENERLLSSPPQLKRDPLGGTSHPTSTHRACEEYQLAASCRQRSGVDAGLQRRVGRGLVCFHAPGMGGGGRCDWACIALDCRSVVSLGRANRANGRGNYGVRFRPRQFELHGGGGCWDSGMVAADRRDGSL